MYIARIKQEQVKERVKERKLEKEMQEGLNNLPSKETNKIQTDEQRKTNMDLATGCYNLFDFLSARIGYMKFPVRMHLFCKNIISYFCSCKKIKAYKA